MKKRMNVDKRDYYYYAQSSTISLREVENEEANVSVGNKKNLNANSAFYVDFIFFSLVQKRDFNDIN